MTISGGLAIGCKAEVEMASTTDVSFDSEMDRVSSEAFVNSLGVTNYTQPANSAWADYPESYNMRNEILLLTQDQQPYGLCWAHATTTALETTISKQLNEYYNLAEGWMSLYLAGINSGNYNIGSGGYFRDIFSQFAMLESDLPLDIFDGIDNYNYKTYYDYYSDYSFSLPDYIKPFKASTDWSSYSKAATTDSQREVIRGQVKYFLHENGSLYTSVLSRTKVIDYKNIFVNSGAGHAVSVIGWDDTIDCGDYGTGAWITLNSYGENAYKADEDAYSCESRTNGIYYLPYSIANYGSFAGFVIDRSESTLPAMEIVGGNDYEVKKYDKTSNWSNKESMVVKQKNVFAYNPAGTSISLTYECINASGSDISSIKIWQGNMDITNMFDIVSNADRISITSKSDTNLDWGTYKIEIIVGSTTIVKPFLVMAELGMLSVNVNNTGSIITSGTRRNRILYHNTQISGVNEFYTVDNEVELYLATYSALGYDTNGQPMIAISSLDGNVVDNNANKVMDKSVTIDNTSFTLYYLGKEKYSGYSGGSIRIRFAGRDNIKIVLTSETGIEYAFVIHYIASPGTAVTNNEVNTTDPYMTHVTVLLPKDYELSSYDKITYSTNSSYQLPQIVTDGYRIRYWQISYNTFTTICAGTTATIDLLKYEYEYTKSGEPTGNNYLLSNYTTSKISTIFSIILKPVIVEISNITDASNDSSIRVSTSITMSAAAASSGIETTVDQTGTWYSFVYNSIKDTSGAGNDGVEKLSASVGALKGSTNNDYTLESQTITWYKGSISASNIIIPDSNGQITIKNVADSGTYICTFDLTLKKKADNSIIELHKQQLKRIIVKPIELDFDWSNLTSAADISVSEDKYVISKDYDSTTTLSQNSIDWIKNNLVTENKVVAGDTVSIDNVTYDNELVGTGKALSYTLSGTGCDNYVIANTLSGTIEKGKIQVHYAGLTENGLVKNAIDGVWEKEYDGNEIAGIYAYYDNNGVNVRLGDDKWECDGESVTSIPATAIGKIYTLSFGNGDIDTNTSELVAEELKVRIVKKHLTANWVLDSGLSYTGIYGGFKQYSTVYTGTDILPNISATIDGYNATFDVYYNDTIMNTPNVLAVGMYKLQIATINGEDVNYDYYDITDGSIYINLGKLDITIDWSVTGGSLVTEGQYIIDYADVDLASQIGHKYNTEDFCNLEIKCNEEIVNNIIGIGTYTVSVVGFDTDIYNIINPSIELVVSPIDSVDVIWESSYDFVNGKYQTSYSGESIILDTTGAMDDAEVRAYWQVSTSSPKHYLPINITIGGEAASEVKNSGTYSLQVSSTSANITNAISGGAELVINKISLDNTLAVPNSTTKADGVHYTYDGSDILQSISCSEAVKDVANIVVKSGGEVVTEIINAGTYTVALDYDKDNYTISNDEINLIIDKRPVVVEWQISELTKSNNKYIAEYSARDFVNNISATYTIEAEPAAMLLTITKNGEIVDNILNVGEYIVSINANFGANYEVIGDASQTIEIIPRTIRVVADIYDYSYGEAVPANPGYMIYDGSDNLIDMNAEDLPQFNVTYSNNNIVTEIAAWRYQTGEDTQKSCDIILSMIDGIDYSNWDITLVNGSLSVTLQQLTINFRKDNSVVGSKSIVVYQTQQISDPIEEFRAGDRGLSAWYNGDDIVDLNTFVPTSIRGYILNTYSIYSVKYVNNMVQPSVVIKEMSYHAKAPIYIPTMIDTDKSPKKFGYTLTGWNIDNDTYLLNMTTTTSQLGLEKDVELTPYFTPTIYSLTLIVRQDNVPTSQYYTYNYTIEDYDNNIVINLQAPSIEGWWLEGIYYNNKNLNTSSIYLNMLFERSQIEEINASSSTKVVLEARYQIFQRILTVMYQGKAILTESLSEGETVNWKYLDTLVKKKFGYIYTYSTNDSNSFIVVKINEFPLLYVCLGGTIVLAIALTMIIRTIKKRRLEKDKEILSKLLNKLDAKDD